MLVINPRQIGIFQAVAEVRFESSLAKYFRDRHGSTLVRLPSGTATLGSLPEATLNAMMRNGRKRARQYGITGQAAIAGFITLMIEAAPNFDTDEYLHPYLIDTYIEPNDRIGYLLERATKEDWIAVKEAYDPMAWEIGREGDSAWRS